MQQAIDLFADMLVHISSETVCKAKYVVLEVFGGLDKSGYEVTGLSGYEFKGEGNADHPSKLSKVIPRPFAIVQFQYRSEPGYLFNVAVMSDDGDGLCLFEVTFENGPKWDNVDGVDPAFVAKVVKWLAPQMTTIFQNARDINPALFRTDGKDVLMLEKFDSKAMVPQPNGTCVFNFGLTSVERNRGQTYGVRGLMMTISKRLLTFDWPEPIRRRSKRGSVQ
jgi:hypothetical protein